MLHYDFICGETFMGEPPPVLYIYGPPRDFHRLAISLLPLIKKTNTSRIFSDMELIHNLSDFVVAINNKGNGGLSFDNEAKKLCISLTKEEWIDIIIALIHIALDPSTIFMEPSDDYLHEWTKKIDFTIILESTYEQN